MPIDDSAHQYSQGIEFDNQQDSRVVRSLARHSDLLTLLLPALAADTGFAAMGLTAAVGVAVAKFLVQRRADDNIELLLRTWVENSTQMNRIVGALHDRANGNEETTEKLRQDVKALASEEKEFRDIHLGPLILDAIRRAEGVRAKDRIERIAKILAYATDHGSGVPPDNTEELIRIAVDLSDRDVLLLREIYAAQVHLVTTGVVPGDQVNDVWRNQPPRVTGIGESEIQSICAKLQSFGLIVRVERNNFKVAIGIVPYALVPKGKDFIEFLRERT
jgi:hypothetical protein